MNKQSTGCILEEPLATDYNYELIVGGATELPEEFKVAREMNFYQNGLDSCAGAGVAEAKSVQEDTDLSPRFIWGQAKKMQNYKGWGTYISLCLRVVTGQGAPRFGAIDEEVVGVDREKYMRPILTDNLLEGALEHRAKSYWIAHDIETAKRAIFEQKTPIVTSLMWYDSYVPDEDGFITYSEGSSIGGHCVTMNGWGSEFGREYILFKNSWGKNWGDNGFFKIYTDELLKFWLRGLYIIVDMPSTKAQLLNKYDNKLIKEEDDRKVYYVGGGKIVWIRNEESFEYGRNLGWWGDWEDINITKHKIEEDFII